MLIASYISIALALPALFLVMRYNLHMFQQNGYKNAEHARWLTKNVGKQALLLGCTVLGVVLLVCPVLPLLIVAMIVWLIVIRYYWYLRSSNTKKRLVYTMRVRRQIATDAVLMVAAVVLVGVLWDVKRIGGALTLAIAVQGIILLLVNIINKPLEHAVAQHFINDAKRKLRSVPNLTVIGVTGSYGKTSVKYYLQTLLSDHFNTLITPESYNTPMGVVKTIRESLKPTHEIFVCEMGAKHIGDIKEICDIVHPKHGVITSVGPQHLETFHSMENVAKTKFELADALPEGGMLFANTDCEYIADRIGNYERATSYSIKQGDFTASDISVSPLGTEFTVTAPNGDTERFQTRLIGEYNVINVLGAISVAVRLGIKLSELRVPVRRIQSVKHRMELLMRGNVTIIDDAYNSNPVGSKAAVETLAIFDGVRILVTPGMIELGEKEEEYNYKFGTYAAACCDYILLVGKKHTEPILKGALDSGFDPSKCIAYDKLSEALEYAYAVKDEGHKYILLENDLPDNLA